MIVGAFLQPLPPLQVRDNVGLLDTSTRVRIPRLSRESDAYLASMDKKSNVLGTRRLSVLNNNGAAREVGGRDGRGIAGVAGGEFLGAQL
jgi:hypothetical protein